MIITDFSVRYAEMITRVSLDLRNLARLRRPATAHPTVTDSCRLPGILALVLVTGVARSLCFRAVGASESMAPDVQTTSRRDPERH